MLSSTNPENPATSSDVIVSNTIVKEYKADESSTVADTSSQFESINFCNYNFQDIQQYILNNNIVDTRAFYLMLLKSDSFDFNMIELDDLATILDHFRTDEMNEVLLRYNKQNLHNIFHTMTDLVVILNKLDMSDYRDFLKYLGIDFVKNLILNRDGISNDPKDSHLAELLQTMMVHDSDGETNTNSVALTFLREDLGIDYVRSLTNNTENLRKIIPYIDCPEQVYFITWLDTKFILKNMVSKKDEFIRLLKVNYLRNRSVLLNCFNIDVYQEIITDTLYLRSILETLQNSLECLSFIEHLTTDVVFKICKTHYDVNLIAGYLSDTHREMFLLDYQEYYYANPNSQSSSGQANQSSNSHPTLTAADLRIRRKSKIDAAVQALIAGKGNCKLPTEANTWIHVGCSFLEKLNIDSALQESDLDMDIAKIIIGSLIAAAATCKAYGGKLDYIPISLEDLKLKCDIKNAMKDYDKNDYRFKFANTDNPYYDVLIHRTGEKIFSGEITYNDFMMRNTFNELPEHFDVVLALLNAENLNRTTTMTFPTVEELAQMRIPPTPYEKVVTLFDEIFDNLPEETNTSIITFNQDMKSLRDYVLHSMQTGNVLFDYVNCVSISDSCYNLIDKVSTGSVTKFDCHKFFNDTYKFHTDKMFEVIVKTILGAITGMILAASVGFLAGNVLGAAVGAGIGFFAGGLSAAAVALDAKCRDDVFVVAYRDARNLRS